MLDLEKLSIKIIGLLAMMWHFCPKFIFHLMFSSEFDVYMLSSLRLRLSDFTYHTNIFHFSDARLKLMFTFV